MWIDLYLVTAGIVAFGSWLVTDHLQSIDPPSDIVRGFWALLAGAMWPVVLTGVAQLFAVRYVAQRLRPAPAVYAGPPRPVAVQDVGAC